VILSRTTGCFFVSTGNKFFLKSPLLMKWTYIAANKKSRKLPASPRSHAVNILRYSNKISTGTAEPPDTLDALNLSLELCARRKIVQRVQAPIIIPRSIPPIFPSSLKSMNGASVLPHIISSNPKSGPPTTPSSVKSN